MSEICYEVKRAKYANILIIILCAFVELLFGGVIIFFIISFVNKEYKSHNNPSTQLGIGIFCFVFIWLIFFAMILVEIYLIKEGKNQTDVYTAEKMYRKSGEKIIFELEYSKIETIKEGFFAYLYTFCIFCYEPIIKKNGKKGPKTIIEYYTKKDREKIKEIISQSSAFNLKQ